MDDSHDYINLVRLTSRLERACLDLSSVEPQVINSFLTTAHYGQSILKRLQADATSSNQERGSLPDLAVRLQSAEAKLANAHKPADRLPLRKQLPPHLEVLRPPAPVKPQQPPQEVTEVTKAAEAPEPSSQAPARSPREELLDRPPSVFAQRSKSNHGDPLKSKEPKESADSSHLLRHHREVQEGLTEDLAGMARQLKLNSLHFADSLEKDKGLITGVEDRMSGNYDSMQSNRTRLGAYERKGGWTFCFTMMAVAGVCCAWFFMFALSESHHRRAPSPNS